MPKKFATDTGDASEVRRSGRIAARSVLPAAEVKPKPRAVKKRTAEQSNDSTEAEGATSKEVCHDSFVEIYVY